MTEVRGRMNDAVHIGASSCACLPIARARAFSRATLAAVAASSGRVKVLSTARGWATGGGTFGRTIRARTVSLLPEECVNSAFATSVPSVSTGTAPIACQLPLVGEMKCSGSSAMVPRTETTGSGPDAGAVSVSRTIAPGSGCAGATTRRAVCAERETLKKLDRASTVAVQVFKGYPCIESVRQKLTYDLHPKLSLGFVRSEPDQRSD